MIAVDPRHHGQGWGRSLTVAGLESIARRGVTVGMLYTDATNEAAVALYRSLGFTVDHVDRSYRRDPPARLSAERHARRAAVSSRRCRSPCRPRRSPRPRPR